LLSQLEGTVGRMAASIDMTRLAVARADRWARHAMGDEDGSARGAVVVTIADETMLETLTDLRWRLSVILEPGPSTLVLDLSQVRELSSAAIAVLLWVKKRCRARSVHLVVRGPAGGGSEVLRRTGLATRRATGHPGLRRRASTALDSEADS
jgi:anti-anti-sigma factor